MILGKYFYYYKKMDKKFDTIGMLIFSLIFFSCKHKDIQYEWYIQSGYHFYFDTFNIQ